MHRRPSRNANAVLGAMAVVAVTAALAMFALVTAAPAGAQTAPSTQVRLAHFSPDAPAMDVFLSGADGQQRLVLAGLAFGQVSQYMPVAPGVYTFALRPAGSSPSGPAAITGSAELGAAGAYTFAALGQAAQARTALYADDLTAPAAGRARVRLIQAASSAPQVDVRVVGGPVLADGVGYTSATTYAEVPAGSWQIQVTEAPAGPATVQQLDVPAGVVASLVVLDDPDSGSLRLTSLVDATGMAGTPQAAPAPASASAAAPTTATPAVQTLNELAVSAMPAGGVDTGRGGTAPQPHPGDARPMAIAAAASVVLALTWAASTRRAIPLRVRSDRGR